MTQGRPLSDAGWQRRGGATGSSLRLALLQALGGWKKAEFHSRREMGTHTKSLLGTPVDFPSELLSRVGEALQRFPHPSHQPLPTFLYGSSPPTTSDLPGRKNKGQKIVPQR